jgi:hypothetical protein
MKMKQVPTWAGRSRFGYAGSVEQGTVIRYGRNLAYSITVSADQYAALLNHFRGRTVNIGTTRIGPPPGSVGEWLQSNVAKTAIASYVGRILIDEGYAERVEEGAPEISFSRFYPDELIF